MPSIKSYLRKLRSEGKFVTPLNMLAKANYQRVNLRDYLNKDQLTRQMADVKAANDLGSQIDFALNAAQGFLRPMQNTYEISELMRRVGELRPKRVLEIGTARGGTLFLFCRNAAPDATIVSVDLPFGINGGGYPDWKVPLYKDFAQPDQNLILIRADSHADATKEEVIRLAGQEPFDLIMIDADHRYEGVKRDFELYGPLIAPGGMIVMHDILPNRYDAEIQVDRFWSEVKARFKTDEIVENSAQGNMGIGLVRDFHAAT
jgi:predicted O-methyltransferase YrrM